MSDKPFRSLGVLELSNCYPPNIGGVETHLDDLVAYLGRRGWRVKVLALCPLTTRVPWKSLESSEGLEVWRLWWFGRNWFHVLEHYVPLQFLYLVPRLWVGLFVWMLRRSSQIDVVHAHGLAAGVCAACLGPAFRKRIVFSSHAVYGLGQRGLLSVCVRHILQRFDAILTLSEQSRQELISVGLKPGTVGRFCYWVDLEKFRPLDPAACRVQLGLPAEGFVCLFVGRLIEIKGVRVLLDLAADERFRHVTFVIAGVGPLEVDVKATAARCANVSFVGGVANRDLPPYYAAADVLCVPSQYQEGFGRVIVESLACGTPVVGANCSGIREATSADTAWLVEPTAASFGHTLAQLVTEPARARGLRDQCRALAVARYSEANGETIVDALSGEDRTDAGA